MNLIILVFTILSISFGNVGIQSSESLKILSMEVNGTLSWNEQIFSVAKDAVKCLGFLSRSRKYFSSSNLLLIYKTYIRPRLEYNSHIFAGAPSTALQYLDKIQKRAVRIINDTNVTKD